jgi:hypothetical protein
MDRIYAAEVLDESFAFAPGFTLEVYAAQAFGAYQDPAQYGEVIWRFAHGAAERLCPAPHGFMADDDPARREQVLDHPQAERKADREPDSLLDDVRREPVAAINGFRCRHHRAQIADVRRHFVNLTVPLK